MIMALKLKLPGEETVPDATGKDAGGLYPCIRRMWEQEDESLINAYAQATPSTVLAACNRMIECIAGFSAIFSMSPSDARQTARSIDDEWLSGFDHTYELVLLAAVSRGVDLSPFKEFAISMCSFWQGALPDLKGLWLMERLYEPCVSALFNLKRALMVEVSNGTRQDAPGLQSRSVDQQAPAAGKISTKRPRRRRPRSRGGHATVSSKKGKKRRSSRIAYDPEKHILKKDAVEECNTSRKTFERRTERPPLRVVGRLGHEVFYSRSKFNRWRRTAFPRAKTPVKLGDLSEAQQSIVMPYITALSGMLSDTQGAEELQHDCKQKLLILAANDRLQPAVDADGTRPFVITILERLHINAAKAKKRRRAAEDGAAKERQHNI